MGQIASGILKGSQVRLTGTQTLSGPAAAAPAPARGVQARIIERTGDDAVVEIVCDCGKVIRLRCTCAQAATAGNADP